MKRFLIRLFLASAACAFASCVNHYQNPPDDPAQYGVIKNSFKSGGANIWKYENYIVEKVDGLQVNYRWSAPGKARIRLAPGSHRVLLDASQSGGFQSAPFKVVHELTFSARAGRTYIPRGKVEGASVTLWIEDEATGKTVSEKDRRAFGAAFQNRPPTIFIPPVQLR